MKPQNEDPKDDLRLIVTNLEEAPEEEVILDDDEDVIAEESIIEDDDVPVAVTVDEAIQSKRSGWRLFSSEDLPQLTLREILGGDYLLGSVLRRNIGFILLLVGLGILYISNRYAAQQEIIEEENLRKELVEKKNYALTQYAELTMRSRQSSIERRLQSFGDSLLTSATEAPFIIRVKKNN